jgi:hypothetical protein
MTARLLAALLTIAPLPAQVGWTAPAVFPAPPGRDNMNMAADLARQRVVLFGGHAAAGGMLADTWEWDGTAWLQATPPTSPPARQEHPLAYDLYRQQTLLFSGWNGATYLADTWTWDGTTWTQRTPAQSPPPRSHTAMAGDITRGRVVLFGGWDWRSGRYGDTWEWDGTTWSNVTPATSPPARADHAMAFDPFGGRMLLFGGSVGAGDLNDTWEWDGTAWVQRQPVVSPPARRHHSLVYDDLRQRVVLFGGDINGVFQNDHWEWAGSTWIQRTLPGAPAPRSDHAAAFSGAGGRMLLFGGRDSTQTFGDTWLLGTSNPALYGPFGQGCAGSAGTPLLGARSLPWLGETMTLTVQSVPQGAAVFVTLGFSRTSWLGIPLPLDLTPAGAPGCRLNTSLALLLAAPSQGGVATLQLPLPADPALLGGQFFDQALVFDPPANALGLAFSNGGEGTVGVR